MDDLAFASAAETAALVRTGDATAREVVEAALRRIEALDPALNAFIEIDGERALAAADAVTPGDAQPFAGVPIAIKGNMPVEGCELNYGSRFLAGHRPDHSAYLVRRLREAGFVIVGHHEPAGVRDPADDRAAPHRRRRATRGTSSARPAARRGGSAAAVAAGMLPLAHGNDGGGSIRIPAACCGLVGLKPSRGRVSRGPGPGRLVAGLRRRADAHGGRHRARARRARRLRGRRRELGAAAARALRDRDAARPRAPAGRGHGHEPVRRRRRRRRRSTACAWPRSCCRARARGRRGRAGVADAGRAARSSSASSGRRSRSGSTPACGVRGREPDEDEIEPLSRALYERAQATPSVAYLGAVAQLQALARGLVAFFADYDVLVTPGAGRAAAADRRVQRPRRASR